MPAAIGYAITAAFASNTVVYAFGVFLVESAAFLSLVGNAAPLLGGRQLPRTR